MADLRACAPSHHDNPPGTVADVRPLSPEEPSSLTDSKPLYPDKNDFIKEWGLNFTPAYLSAHGHRAGEDEKTWQTDPCLVGTSGCIAWTELEKQELVDQYHRAIKKLAITGKCVRTHINRAFCDDKGYCKLVDAQGKKVEGCVELDKDEAVQLVYQLGPKGDGSEEWKQEVKQVKRDPYTDSLRVPVDDAEEVKPVKRDSEADPADDAEAAIDLSNINSRSDAERQATKLYDMVSAYDSSKQGICEEGADTCTAGELCELDAEPAETHDIHKRDVSDDDDHIIHTYLVLPRLKSNIGPSSVPIGTCDCGKSYPNFQKFLDAAKPHGQCNQSGNGRIWEYQCAEQGGKLNMQDSDLKWWQRSLCQRCSDAGCASATTCPADAPQAAPLVKRNEDDAGHMDIQKHDSGDDFVIETYLDIPPDMTKPGHPDSSPLPIGTCNCGQIYGNFVTFLQEAKKHGSCDNPDSSHPQSYQCLEKGGKPSMTLDDEQWWEQALRKRCSDAGCASADTSAAPLAKRDSYTHFIIDAWVDAPHPKIKDGIVDTLIGKCDCGTDNHCLNQYTAASAQHGSCKNPYPTDPGHYSCHEVGGKVDDIGPKMSAGDKEWWHQALSKRCVDAGGSLSSSNSAPLAKRSEGDSRDQVIHKRDSGDPFVIDTWLEAPNPNQGYPDSVVATRVGKCDCGTDNHCLNSFLAAGGQHGSCKNLGKEFPKSYSCHENGGKENMSDGDKRWWHQALAKRCTDAGGRDIGSPSAASLSKRSEVDSSNLVARRQANGKETVFWTSLRPSQTTFYKVGMCTCNTDACKNSFLAAASKNGKCTLPEPPFPSTDYNCDENGGSVNMSEGDIQWWDRALCKRCNDAGGKTTWCDRLPPAKRSEAESRSRAVRKRAPEAHSFNTLLKISEPSPTSTGLKVIGKCICDEGTACKDNFLKAVSQAGKGSCDNSQSSSDFVCTEQGGNLNMSQGDDQWWYQAMCKRCTDAGGHNDKGDGLSDRAWATRCGNSPSDPSLRKRSGTGSRSGCRPFTSEEKAEARAFGIDILTRFLSTGKCDKGAPNCNAAGYCDRFDNRLDRRLRQCRQLSDDEEDELFNKVITSIFTKPTHKAGEFEFLPHLKPAENVASASGGKVKRSSTATHADDEHDPDFVTYHPSDSDSFEAAAKPTKHEIREFMALCEQLSEDDEALRAVANAAGVEDDYQIAELREYFAAMAEDREEAIKALEHAKTAQMLGESKFGGAGKSG